MGVSAGRVRRAAGAVVLLMAVACGGGGGGGEPPVVEPPITQRDGLTIQSSGGLDGFAKSTDEASTQSGMIVGDIDTPALSNIGCRGLLSFELSLLPAGVTIVEASLDVYHVSTAGSPFGNHGVVVAFHADYGGSITGADYNCTLLPAGAVVVSQSVVPGHRIVDVTNAVRDDYASGRARTQFRLEFNILDTDADLIQDFVTFEDGDNFYGTGNVPLLTITYEH